MKRLVYDLPTRLFHWLFVVYFLTAFLIAKISDSESQTFSYHMLAGLTLGLLVILRVIWGVLGSAHARFSGFNLKPTDLIQYLRDILIGGKKKWAGHNPASSVAALAMLFLGLGLASSGYLMTSNLISDGKEIFEDLHELFANAFIVTVILHVAGIILHTLRHKEMIALSMITGKKADTSDLIGKDKVIKQHPIIAILFLATVVSFVISLSKNYNPQSNTLQFMGSTLELGKDND